MRYCKTTLIVLCALVIVLLVIGCETAEAVTTAPEKPPVSPDAVASVTTAAITTEAGMTTVATTSVKPIETVTPERVDETPVTVFYPWN